MYFYANVKSYKNCCNFGYFVRLKAAALVHQTHINFKFLWTFLIVESKVSLFIQQLFGPSATCFAHSKSVTCCAHFCCVTQILLIIE